MVLFDWGQDNQRRLMEEITLELSLEGGVALGSTEEENRVGHSGLSQQHSKSTGERGPEPQSWGFVNDDLSLTLTKVGISASKVLTPKVSGDNQSCIRDPMVLSPSWPC